VRGVMKFGLLVLGKSLLSFLSKFYKYRDYFPYTVLILLFLGG